jgi:hypothetical protein
MSNSGKIVIVLRIKMLAETVRTKNGRLDVARIEDIARI